MRALCLAAVLLAACGEDSPKSYRSYQECFDDKFDRQHKMTTESILECCLDHSVGTGSKPPNCGNDDAECINYLTANLSQNDADITIQTTACSAYIAEKNKQ